MKKIRIGKTIDLKWSITTNGVAAALANRDLTLVIADPHGVKKVVNFTIQGVNTIKFTIEGKDQTKVGVYTLTLWENKNLANQSVLDTDAFELVTRTKFEN